MSAGWSTGSNSSAGGNQAGIRRFHRQREYHTLSDPRWLKTTVTSEKRKFPETSTDISTLCVKPAIAGVTLVTRRRLLQSVPS